MKILLTGGGTGGHTVPIIALVSYMKSYFRNEKKEARFLWIGSDYGPEKKMAQENGIPFKAVYSGKFRRYWSVENLTDIFRIIIGFVQSWLIIRKFKPDLLFGKGGYISVPPVLASYFLKVPSLIHESDINMGLANKILLPFVKKIAITFQETEKDIKEKYRDKVVVTGNPIRKSILKGSKEEGLKEFKFNKEKSVVLVLGGSQGAVRINEVVIKSLPKLLDNYQIIHLCGDKNYRDCGSLLTVTNIKDEQEKSYQLVPSLYGSKLANAFACADLVISRGGLNTLFELALLSKPSIIIPYPYAASNHQEENAKKIAKSGAIELIRESDLDSKVLIGKINYLFKNKDKLDKLASKIYEFGHKVNKDASKKITEELLQLDKQGSIKDITEEYKLDENNVENIDLTKVNKVFLVGIGGIGMSALARILREMNKKILGSDVTASKVTNDLEKLNVEIKIGEHKKENIKEDIDLLVYSNAIKMDNSEILRAKEFKIPTISYPELLGMLSRDKFTICISGTHGKTTVTALSSLIMDEAGFDPTCVIGSNIKEFKGNARLGKSKYFVLEADEYKEAFLNYDPNIIVLNNVEFEHPDFFKDLNDVKDKFKKFVRKLPKKGLLLVNYDDKNTMEVAQEASCQVATFGLKKGADFRAYNIKQVGVNILYDVEYKKQKIVSIKLKLSGRHNVYNSLASIVLSRALKISLNEIKEVVEKYEGAWRRFELKGEERGIMIIDDYAHHPTEIKTTLAGARMKYPKRRIMAVLQPHHEDRFEAMFDDFARSFKSADLVLVSDVYHVRGRELKSQISNVKDNSKNSKLLSEKIGEKAIYTDSLDKTLEWLSENTREGDIVVTLGAGDVTKIGSKLLAQLKNR